jgi:L-asparaginase
MKPKIALIFCGGTIGMIKDPETGALTPAKDAQALLDVVPELDDHLDLDFHELVNIDSSNMNPGHWQQIAEKINELYKDYDGFVIAQGTDTMAYSASAVAYALQGLSKPVVFTGSIVPLSEIGADGRNNLIYACLVASMDLAEVCIVFGNKIVRAVRAKKNHESFVQVFDSPNYPLLGEIERPIKLNEWRQKRENCNLEFKPEFNSNVGLLKMFPGFSLEILDGLINRGAKGVLIEGFGPGNLPSEVADGVKKLVDNGIAVVIGTQMEHGVANLQAYEAGYKVHEAGAISGLDMTTEAALTKLMWCLAQTEDIAEVRDMMTSNLVGELSVD